MATRKKRVLTPEEQLEAALVPESEWPYEVPENWCWVRIGSVNSYKSSSVDPSKTPGRIFELYSVPSLEEDYPEIIAGSEIGSTKQSVQKDDVLLCKINPRINRVWKVTKYTDETLIASSEWVVIRSAVYEPDFLMHCLSAHFFREQLLSHVSGVGGSLMRAQPRYIKDYVIPLPPLHEQRRIASRIEWLFAKLDDAEAELREVIDSSEQRQAAILHKAFNGELTAAWRNENEYSRKSWKRTVVKDVCKDVKVGIVIKPSQYYTDEVSGTRAFRSANVREFRIEDSDWVYINDEGMCDNQRSIVHTGDVLIVRSGNPGTACVVDETYDGCNAIDILIAVPDKTKVTSEYLCAFTNSPAGKALVAQNKRGMALMHFNVKSYSALEIPLPTIEEQHIIVSKLTHLLDYERLVRSHAEVALANIKMTRSSILAKALRGELGTNDPDEPNSKELLASIFSGNAG